MDLINARKKEEIKMTGISLFKEKHILASQMMIS